MAEVPARGGSRGVNSVTPLMMIASAAPQCSGPQTRRSLLTDENVPPTWKRFMARFAEACQGVVAIDGKVLRRSFDTASGHSPLHMVSAWACEQQLVLGQIATEAKSNEITAVPKLLKLFSLDGCTVTVDDCGNMFARRPGKRADLPPICMGSHLDTQPTGGKFDGVLGVLGALEAMRTLHESGYETNAPLEVGYNSALPCLLALEAMQQNRVLGWDAGARKSKAL